MALSFCIRENATILNMGIQNRLICMYLFKIVELFFHMEIKLLKKISDIQKRIHRIVSPEELNQMLTSIFKNPIEHNIKYVFNKSFDVKLKSRPLIPSEYLKYLEFYKKVHPNCKKFD